MRHHSKTKKFGRERGVRKQFMRDLARNLIVKGKITTSVPRAKALRGLVEPMITKMADGTPAAERIVRAELGGSSFPMMLMRELGRKYKERPGGYTRITRCARRKSDGSEMAQISFV